jgi:predicted RNA-binding protein with PUA-like domain
MRAAARHWLVKQEPGSYPWPKFVADRGTAWTGVRNFAARAHLRAMRAGDQVLYYHTGDEKCVVGLAKVARVAYPDPTTDVEDRARGEWFAVDLKPVRTFAKSVSLAQIKIDRALQKIELIRQSRLSVLPLTAAEFARIVKLGG